MIRKIAAIVWACTIVFWPHYAHTQTLPSHKLIGAAELDDELAYRLERDRFWVQEFDKYMIWEAEWINYYGPISKRSDDGRVVIAIEKRRRMPLPPPWLPNECDNSEAIDQILTDACSRIAIWRESVSVHAMRLERMAAIADAESPKKSFIVRKMNLDTMWVVLQNGPMPYAPLGLHMSFVMAGRFEIFAFPGALLLSVPLDKAHRTLEPAWDFGAGYRIVDFHMPLLDRDVSLHFNFAKAFLFGGDTGPSISMAGFSLSPK